MARKDTSGVYLHHTGLERGSHPFVDFSQLVEDAERLDGDAGTSAGGGAVGSAGLRVRWRAQSRSRRWAEDGGAARGAEEGARVNVACAAAACSGIEQTDGDVDGDDDRGFAEREHGCEGGNDLHRQGVRADVAQRDDPTGAAAVDAGDEHGGNVAPEGVVVCAPCRGDGGKVDLPQR